MNRIISNQTKRRREGKQRRITLTFAIKNIYSGTNNTVNEIRLYNIYCLNIIPII